MLSQVAEKGTARNAAEISLSFARKGSIMVLAKMEVLQTMWQSIKELRFRFPMVGSNYLTSTMHEEITHPNF